MLVFAAVLLAFAAAQAPGPTKIDAYGANSVRVRVAPAGGAITEPPLQALAGAPPPPRTPATGDGVLTLTNGNLRVQLDPATALLTATRLSDGAVLLRQTALAFGAPDVPGTRPGSVRATVTFAGTPGEKVYGLGEHRTGRLQQLPYAKRFADSQDYQQSHGSDVSIPWYASSLGYGFVWNSPAYGSVSIDETAITWAANATLGVDLWITTTPADFDPASGISPYAPLLSQYVDAVGHASTMPYYATGFVQCKDRYRNQSRAWQRARRPAAALAHLSSPNPPTTTRQRNAQSCLTWRGATSSGGCPLAQSSWTGSTGWRRATGTSTPCAGPTRRAWWMSFPRTASS